MATEGIKQFLGEGFELAFVVQIYNELLAVQKICYMMFLGIVGYEPINQTKADVAFSLENGDQLINVRSGTVKTLKAHNQELFAAGDLSLPCIGAHTG